jgi:hypothetical protein
LKQLLRPSLLNRFNRPRRFSCRFTGSDFSWGEKRQGQRDALPLSSTLLLSEQFWEGNPVSCRWSVVYSLLYRGGVGRGRGNGRGLGVGVGLGVTLGAGVSDGVGVAVGVTEGVVVAVGVCVGVGVRVGVGVAVGVGVGVEQKDCEYLTVAMSENPSKPSLPPVT